MLPEVLVERLVRRTQRAATCPLPSGPWSSACGDLPRCSLSGHGSCLFTCESIKHGLLPLARRASCNLDVCSQNLTLSSRNGRLRFVCADGSACPET